jgi:riboflavin synthase
MFTGIINEIGEIISIKMVSDNLSRITIKCAEVLKDILPGESISVNGVCLSVTKYDDKSFSADIMQETINKTTFKNSKIKYVNLEKSLKVNSRLDGHFVTGHIDGTGKIKSLVKKEGNYLIGIYSGVEIINGIVYKGSVSLNGISLTVSDVKKDLFYVSIIPVTLENTNLKYYNINEEVNIETDILGKYIIRYMKTINQKSSNITKEFLLNNY